MTPRLLLVIDPEALSPAAGTPAGNPLQPPATASTEPAGNPGWPMRRGSLFALKKLSERGIQPAMANGRHPAAAIAALLEQEEVALADPGSAEWKDQPLEQYHVAALPDGSLHLDKSDNGTDRTRIPDRSGDASGRSFADWPALAAWLLGSLRSATRNRKTAETDISVSINLDGTGKSHIDTGIPFYDHMLEQIARHGYMDLEIICRGDLEIDEHHTIEDTAITLGEAIGEALGDKRGIGRYGFAVAMDETRSLVALDLSGRPWCVFEGTFHREKVGDFPTEMTSHFFHSLAMALRATLHVSVKGENDHHQIEACFKGLARCLRQAVDRNEHYLDILPSSKGML
jgi:imidazoleglycerol phosphate dehydratase HisB